MNSCSPVLRKRELSNEASSLGGCLAEIYSQDKRKRLKSNYLQSNLSSPYTAFSPRSPKLSFLKFVEEPEELTLSCLILPIDKKIS